MSPQADWFADNAPQSSGDWFAQNQPGQQQPPSSGPSWENFKRGMMLTGEAIYRQAAGISTPGIAYDLYKKATGQPVDLKQTAENIITTTAPLMVGAEEMPPAAEGVAGRVVPKSEVPGMVSKAARHLPYVGKYLRAYDFVRDLVGQTPPPEIPTPRPPVLPPAAPPWTEEMSQANALSRIPPTGARPASQTGEALATLSQGPPASQAVPRAQVSRELDAALRKAVGNQPVQPGVPMRLQGRGASPATDAAPPGFTPVESAAVKWYQYDPAKQELSVIANNGIGYVSGEVTPEQAEMFHRAASKGLAWKAIRDNSPLVAKIVNGKRVPVTRTSYRLAGPEDVAAEDLTPQLKESLRQALTQARQGK